MRKVPFTVENIKVGTIFRATGKDYLITKVNEDNPYMVELLNVSMNEKYRGTVYPLYIFDPSFFRNPNMSLWIKDPLLSVEEML